MSDWAAERAGEGGHAGPPAAMPAILTVAEHEELRQALLPHVQAVVCQPREPPEWLADVEDAVQRGAFRIERTEHRAVRGAEMDRWIDECLPWRALGVRAAAALTDELHEMVALAASLTEADVFTYRALTDFPDSRCGFHVDTVPPGAAPYALLRALCGAGTEYVMPDHVLSVRDFYRYLALRERLVRQAAEAAVHGDAAAADQARDLCAEIDAAPPFLAGAWEVLEVPPGSLVAFKCIDAARHWSDHPKASAWIHRSPMHGPRRFVLNISAAGPPGRRRRNRPG